MNNIKTDITNQVPKSTKKLLRQQTYAFTEIHAELSDVKLRVTKNGTNSFIALIKGEYKYGDIQGSGRGPTAAIAYLRASEDLHKKMISFDNKEAVESAISSFQFSS